jgi:hypothetical protein
VDFAVRVVDEFAYIAGTGAPVGERIFLPHFALPTLLLFAALLLWFYSPDWAQKTFPNTTTAQRLVSSVDAPKILARLFAIYLIAGSISVVVDFVIRVIARSSDAMGGVFWSAPASWEDFGASFVWLVTGLLLYFRAEKLLGAVRAVGTAIGHDPSPIRSEDDGSKPV